MVKSKERAPTNESLIFNKPEEAREFSERVEGRVREDLRQGVEKRREAVAEEVALEIEREGQETVDTTQPWEHSPQEHQEVQGLVEVAFRENLSLALKRARQCDNYPRIVDLFHDVLTGQMYDALVKVGVNKQKVSRNQVFLLVGAMLLIVIALLVAAFI